MEFKNVSESRSQNMKAIKSISKLEDQISKSLWNKGIRYRRNVKNLYGKPDFSIKKYKIVIFIDSCFWHACPIHGNKPKNNKMYWENKLQRNILRDQAVTDFYKSREWKILRIWEHDFKNDYDNTIKKIVHNIQDVKRANKNQ